MADLSTYGISLKVVESHEAAPAEGAEAVEVREGGLREWGGPCRGEEGSMGRESEGKVA